MQVEILVSFSGTHNGQSYTFSQGEVVEIPNGTDWVKCGFAKPVVDTKKKVKVQIAKS